MRGRQRGALPTFAPPEQRVRRRSGHLRVAEPGLHQCERVAKGARRELRVLGSFDPERDQFESSHQIALRTPEQGKVVQPVRSSELVPLACGLGQGLIEEAPRSWEIAHPEPELPRQGQGALAQPRPYPLPLEQHRVGEPIRIRLSDEGSQHGEG